MLVINKNFRKIAKTKNWLKNSNKENQMSMWQNYIYIYKYKTTKV